MIDVASRISKDFVQKKVRSVTQGKEYFTLIDVETALGEIVIRYDSVNYRFFHETAAFPTRSEIMGALKKLGYISDRGVWRKRYGWEG